MNHYRLLMSLMLTAALLGCQPVNKPEAKDHPFMNWQLNTQQSAFSFLTTKNSDHTEEHTIQFGSGQVDQQGQVSLKLDLATVDTMIPIRDQRLRDILFEVAEFPQAIITAQLEPQMPLLEPFTLPVNLNLHGQQKQVTTRLLIQSVGEQLVVTNFEPVVVNGKDFGLDPAINQLTRIAGLRSINYEVLVDFKLVFEKPAN
jgi:polyisoprenoid-binding protein YceI